ncbi:DUF2806 domain-containing protein [Ectopseudomonas mendocina]
MKFFGEELVIKMWDSFIDKGIGGILRPAQEKRLGKTRQEIRRDELLSLAQAEEDAKKIASGEAIYCGNGQIKLLRSEKEIEEHSDNRIEPYIGNVNIRELASSAQTSEAIQKEVNIAKAIIHAEEELAQSEAEATDKEIEKDWLYAWRGHAEKVSSEELQSLWGRVLAGEVKQPGTFSLRTMDFIKNLTKSEAELIEKVGQFVISDAIFRKLDTSFKEKGIVYSDLLFLQSIGLITGVESSGLSFTLRSASEESYINYILSEEKLIILEDPDPNKVVRIEAYSVTALGKEIFKLAGAKVDLTYLEEAAKHLIGQTKKVSIADRVPSETGYIQYRNKIEVTNS